MSPVLTPEVFSINLIRRQLAFPVRKIALYAAVGYLAIQLVLTTVLLGTGVHAVVKRWALKQELDRRGTEAGSIHLLQTEVEDLHKEIKSDQNQFDVLLALEKSNFPVAGKWAALTETLPSRTWLTHLSGDRKKRSLQIKAVYLIDPSKPFELPVKGWIEALKKDPRFGTGLERLEMETSSRSGSLEKASLYSFDLVAEWKTL